MRIAMIGTRGLPATHGGVERAVEALSKRLVARGHEVTVYGRSGYCEGSELAGVRQIALPAVRTKHLEAVTHTLLASLHVFRNRHAYDVVHFHATGPALFAVIPRLAGLATVATIHGLDWKREKWGRFARQVLKLAARLAVVIPDETIVVSRELQASMRETYGAETTYITNGVDFAELNGDSHPVVGLEPDKFVLFVGRLVPEKQVHVLIEAFKGLKTDLKLVIVGPSLHADDYLARIQRAAASDHRVVLAGPRYGPEKVWLLQNAKVFVQPSTLEGLPIALLEALAAGAQAVVSDIPENLEAVTIQGTRYASTFEAGDADALASALQRVISSNARVIPDASSVTASAFDWDGMTLATERIYEQALRGHT